MRILTLCSLLLLSACTSSYQLATSAGETGISFQELREAVQGEYAVITLKDSVVSGKILEVRSDSLVYELWLYDPWRHPRQAVLFSSVVRIEYNNSLRGMGEWAGIGAATGGFYGLMSTTNSEWRGLATFLGIIGGAPAGLVIGLIAGHTMEYRIQSGADTQGL